MTRVAYLVSDYAAPSHTFVRREVMALRARGVEVLPFSVQSIDGKDDEPVPSLLGRSPSSYLGAMMRALGSAPGRFLSAWRLALVHRPSGLRALVWAQFHFVEAILLARLLQTSGAERLHVHFANSGASVGLIAAHYAAIPFSLTLHGISETDHPAGVLLADKITRADFVACASYFMRAQALRQVDPIHWQKCTVVRCGVDRHALPPVPDARRPLDAPHLVCVGRLSPEKGYFGLLGALAALRDEGLPFRLTAVGDGPDREALQAETARLNLSHAVQFVGFLPENRTLATIASGDALVLASLMEGLPVVLMEALALARPVVAPRVAGIPELVEEGVQGLLFTPSNWNDLTRALRQLLAQRDCWPRWGQAGLKRVEEEFLIDHAAKRLSALFIGES